jgi:hypothetical protein
MPVTIRLVEGLHLTATNRRHMAQILAAGWIRGDSGRLRYQLESVPGAPGRFAYTIRQNERDGFGRLTIRQSRGIIEAAGLPIPIPA